MANNINLLMERLSGEDPDFYKTWRLGGIVHAMVANYLLTFYAKISDQKRGTITEWIDNNEYLWANTINGADTFSEKEYNRKLIVINLLYLNSPNEYSQEIKTPSFFIGMGFSNLREFYANMAFICAWVYKTTGKIIAKTKGLYFLNMYIEPKSSNHFDNLERSLFETPKKMNKDYVDKLVSYTEYIYQNYISEMWSSDTESIENYANQIMIDSRDTINMAIETHKYYEEEKNVFNWDVYWKTIQKYAMYTGLAVIGIIALDKITD